jgi:4-oxalocrotonate tautomerase
MRCRREAQRGADGRRARCGRDETVIVVPRPKEEAVPHVAVKLWTGKSAAQKARVADAVTEAVTASAGCSEESVAVAVEDVEPREWMAKVYGPDIVGARPGTLLKKPGYGPL